MAAIPWPTLRRARPWLVRVCFTHRAPLSEMGRPQDGGSRSTPTPHPQPARFRPGSQLRTGRRSKACPLGRRRWVGECLRACTDFPTDTPPPTAHPTHAGVTGSGAIKNRAASRCRQASTSHACRHSPTPRQAIPRLPRPPNAGMILPTPPGCCCNACHHGQCTPGGGSAFAASGALSLVIRRWISNVLRNAKCHEMRLKAHFTHGLQIRVRRFNSDLGLQYLSAFRGALFFRVFRAVPRFRWLDQRTLAVARVVFRHPQTGVA